VQSRDNHKRKSAVGLIYRVKHHIELANITPYWRRVPKRDDMVDETAYTIENEYILFIINMKYKELKIELIR